MKRHLTSIVTGLGKMGRIAVCGSVALCAAGVGSASGQVIIVPRVQPFVYRPVVVQPPVVVLPRISVQPPVLIAPPVAVQPPVVEAPAPAVSAEVSDLHPLVAPIALYPDPLLSVILPAATYPQQVAAAAQFVAVNPGAADAVIDAQPWEPSVKALAHYPTVLNQMNADAKWTESLGSAFASESAEVSKAIQDLRAQAVQVGSLIATPQIAVINEGGVIAIQPAVETALYVPVFDPLVVYTRPAALTFEAAFVTGPWLVNGFDWAGGTVFVGDWRGAYVVENNVWVRNRYFRVDHYHSWRHDERFGHSPRIARERWAHARAMQGRGNEFRRHLNESRAARKQPSPSNRQFASNAGQAERSKPATQTPAHTANSGQHGGSGPGQHSGAAAAAGHGNHSSGGGGGGHHK